MSPEEKKLEKLSKLFELVNEEYATSDDLIKFTEGILGIIEVEKKQLQLLVEKTDGEASAKNQALLNKLTSQEGKLQTFISKVEKTAKEALLQATQSLRSDIKRVERKIPTKTDLSDLYQEIADIKESFNTLPTELTMNNEAVRDGLELLQGDERLDVSAVKGLEELSNTVSELSKRPTINGGKGKVVEIIAGSNITVNNSDPNRPIVSSTGGSASPLTTKGDLYGYSTVNARLPVGTDGQLLQADSTQATGLKWTTVAGTGDMILAAIQTITGAKTFNDGKLLLRNVADTFSSVFTNTNTVARTYTLPDKNGTVAMTSDITGVNSGTNTGDQNSVVGISGTLAQFNTAVTDADLARTDAANTFTGIQTFSTPIASASVAPMTATVGGGVPTPPNNTTTFLRGDGTFAAPAGSGDMVLASTQTNSGLKTFLNGTLGIRNIANTFTSLFSTAATAARTWTLKDADGTIAFTSDITGTNSGTNTGDNSVNTLYSGLVSNATHTGDVTGATALTIAANAVTNAKAAQMATKTYKGRTSATTGDSEDVPVATLKTDLVLVKADVGLANVDNTSDANKPVSTATQTALNLKQDTSGKDATGGYPGLTLFKINFKNAANTFTNFFTNATTAARTYTFPDKDITVAGLVDITGTNSGVNTGDQTITLTGAVTGSGTGSFATTLATPGTNTVSSTNSNATAHTHAITSSASPGAAASLLATNASGHIGITGTRIVKGWFTDLETTNAIVGSVTGNAATVTTNANLTGQVTSVGNTASLGSFTKAQLDTAVSDGNVLYVGDVTTNATHTGEVTGSGALTVDKTAITNRTNVTAAVGDSVLISDLSDTDNLKKVTVQSIVDLASGGGNTYLNNIYIDQSGGTSDTYGVLAGTINGSNALFTVSQAIYATATLKVYLNGQIQTQGTGEDFVETTPASGTFTFAVAPPTGSLITVEYQKVATGSLPSASFTTLAVSGQSDVVADSAADTLTLVAGTNVTITTNAGTDTVTINASGGGMTFAQAYSLTTLI